MSQVRLKKKLSTNVQTPAEGYAVLYLNEDNELVLRDDQGYDRILTEKEYECAVVVSPDPEMGSITGAGNFKPGGDVELTATPTPDNAFVEWQDSEGGQLSTQNPYTFVMPQQDITITGVFEVIL